MKIIAVLSSFRASIWSCSDIKFTIDLLKCLKTHTVYTYNLRGSHNFFQFLLNKMVFLRYLKNESVEFAQILIFCSFSCLVWIRKVSARAYFFEFFSEKTWECLRIHSALKNSDSLLLSSYISHVERFIVLKRYGISEGLCFSKDFYFL